MMKLQETKAMKLTEGGEADAAIIRKLQLTNDNARCRDYHTAPAKYSGSCYERSVRGFKDADTAG